MTPNPIDDIKDPGIRAMLATRTAVPPPFEEYLAEVRNIFDGVAP